MPAWVDDDFECGREPAVPAKKTTRAKAEGYIADTLGWGRGCQAKLKARGNDARRYNLVRKKK